MDIEDDETLEVYVEECLEHLADIENDLLAIEKNGGYNVIQAEDGMEACRSPPCSLWRYL